MNFTQEQMERIYKFILNYTEDEEFRINSQRKYDEKPSKLSILDIYALEELSRYGNKGYFKKFLEARATYKKFLDVNKIEENGKAYELFDEFVKLLTEDESFIQRKFDEASQSTEVFSQIEMVELASTLVTTTKAKEQAENEEKAREELEYDPLNPIVYSTEEQIRETLENLVFGQFILRLLELPAMQSIKSRKQDGKIANIDKPTVIKNVRQILIMEDFPRQLKEEVDDLYEYVKKAFSQGKGEEVFGEYLQYNTNISSHEILKVEKDDSEDIYKLFQDQEKKNPTK